MDRWTRPECYAGAEWPDYYGSGFGQNRDSDALTRSNFRCALKALGGESDTVRVVREGHWAVGWVEWIAIHETDSKALAIADKLQADMKDYPVVDESDWQEEEQEEANQTWANCYTCEERVRYIREHKSQFEFSDFKDMMGCARGRYFAGYASELLN